MIGQTLGRYRVLARIGAGGMGEVYRARDEQLERDVAVKVLPASQFADPEARRRLLREARAAASLNHPNVCTIHEVGEAGGQVFLAMELIEGQRLDRLIPAGGLSADDTLRHGLQIADAVAHAHERGIVHRDLKASNTLVTPEGRAKVLDFGLAKRLREGDVTGGDTESAPLTDAGAVIGTVPYMAPEVLSGQPADARSDVWSLGVVLFEMASGNRPFRGRTGFELSSAILNQPPAALPETVPPELAVVIERCLEKAPERRYQRAGELHAALQALPSGTARSSIRRSSRTRLVWVLAALAGAVALALVLARDAGGVRTRLFAPAAAPAAPIRLAVMPFRNLTGDPAQEYLSDGLTEEMIAQLGRLNPQRLGVIARTSAMRYKETAKPVDQIGRELGVDYILEGSARREGSRVRINAQLIEVRDQTQRWADSYERELSGILQLQSEVARGVARSLAVTLLPEQQARAAVTREVDPRAFDEYLKGRFQMAKRTIATLEAAAAHFERAIGFDSDYALAHAGLADVRVLQPFFTGRDYRPALARAEAAANRALELDPSLAQAHAALALAKEYAFQWEPAEIHFRRALELDPGYATAHHWYADLLARRGRSKEALAEIRRALELDPLSPIINQDLGYVLDWAGEHEAAIRQYRRTVELDPEFSTTWRVLGLELLEHGRYDEAKEAFRRWARLTGADEPAVVRLTDAAAAYARTGVPQPMPTDVGAYFSPTLHMLLGRDEETLAILEKASAEGAFSPLMSMRSPAFDRIRSQPRFVAIWNKAGLPPRPARR